MEVKDFIKETVAQILDSVSELNETYAEKGATIASLGNYNYKGQWSKHYVTEVDFDIALEVVEDKESGVGGKLNVASIISGGGNQISKQTNQATSKVHFTLPVMFPESK